MHFKGQFNFSQKMACLKGMIVFIIPEEKMLLKRPDSRRNRPTRRENNRKAKSAVDTNT